MFIIRLSDGLGNQLFQYAYALAVHELTGQPVFLDRSWFPEFGGKLRTATERHFSMGRYSLSLPFAESGLADRIIYGEGFRGMWNRFMHFRPGQLREGRQNIDPASLMHARRSYVMRGFFQKAAFCEKVRPTLLRELVLENKTLNQANLDMLAQMEAAGEAATFVHVRRGDYLSPINASVFHSCGADYYRAAERKLAETVGRPLHLFIFSDDPQWVKENYRSDFPITCVDFNSPNEGCLDINLMRHCHHAIIANSTFSWWGAWLIDTPGKVIIAPSRWYTNRETEAGLLPADWLVM